MRPLHDETLEPSAVFVYRFGVTGWSSLQFYFIFEEDEELLGISFSKTSL